MALVFPFQPYRYTPAAGPIGNLVTQPYDKISPAMQARYLSLSPYNLVRLILGERYPGDTNLDNVYTRAARHLREWIARGVLERVAERAFFAYSQEFVDPDSGERLVRKGFIGLGQLEEYAAGVVHRHEQTLSGPKKDRLELLRHTQAHFGQIFMLYPDPEQAVNRMLDDAARQEPLVEVADEYGVEHRVWMISDSGAVAAIQEAMADKKLIIADGHHRYETALAFSKECSKADAQRVMMTFVNMHSPGLRILATHRLVSGLAGFRPATLLAKLERLGRLACCPSLVEFRTHFGTPDPSKIRVGIAFPADDSVHVLEVEREEGALDAAFVHERILDQTMGISHEAVREEKYLRYFRGIDATGAELGRGQAQVAFLLQPTTIEQVARVSFSGGVMPQKSTDFYPKLLSGLTVYRLEQ